MPGHRSQAALPTALVGLVAAVTAVSGTALAASWPERAGVPAPRAAVSQPLELTVAPAPLPPAPPPAPVAPPPPPPPPAVAPAPPPEPAPAPPAPRPRPAPRPQPAPTPPPPSGPTSWPELNAAIAAVPGYDGSARWVVSDEHGSWGAADMVDTIWVSPRVPLDRLRDVVLHEWSHLLSARPYGDPWVAVDELNAFFGGSGLEGTELAADCIALALGARWTRYTPCRDPRWRDAASRLLAGRPA